MKVIKTGKGNGKWVKRFICNECSAVLEIEKSDLYVVNTAVNWAGETWDPRLMFKCVECGITNDATNNVPAEIQYDLFYSAKDRL